MGTGSGKYKKWNWLAFAISISAPGSFFHLEFCGGVARRWAHGSRQRSLRPAVKTLLVCVEGVVWLRRIGHALCCHLNNDIAGLFINCWLKAPSYCVPLSAAFFFRFSLLFLFLFIWWVLIPQCIAPITLLFFFCLYWQRWFLTEIVDGGWMEEAAGKMTTQLCWVEVYHLLLIGGE